MQNKFPENIIFQTHPYCNAECVFCPYGKIKNKITRKSMNDWLFKKIVDEISEFGNVKRIMPYLMNEPLMDEFIEEKINYIKEKNPASCVHILTNGSLLDKNRALKIINSKIDWIGISIHGIYPQTIKKSMGINSDDIIKRLCDFIEIVKKSQKRLEDFIMITFLKHEYLENKEKEEIIEFWRSKGISRINYFEGPVSRAGNVKSLPAIKNSKIYGCNSVWAQEMVHILSDGDVVLCCMDWQKEVVLGNVKKHSIYEIWNSERYNYVREIIKGHKKMPDNFLCSRCESAKNYL